MNYLQDKHIIELKRRTLENNIESDSKELENPSSKKHKEQIEERITLYSRMLEQTYVEDKINDGLEEIRQLLTYPL